MTKPDLPNPPTSTYSTYPTDLTHPTDLTYPT